MTINPTINNNQHEIDWYPNNPVKVFEFSVIDEHYIENSNPIPLQKDVQNIHLEIIGNKNLSLLAVNEVVNLFETQCDTEINWNVTISSIINPHKILVCCVEVPGT